MARNRDHRLDLLTPAGVKFAEVTDFDWLACSLRVNSPGQLRAQFRGAHVSANQLAHLGQVHYWRRDRANGIGWYRHFAGVYLGQVRAKSGPTSKLEIVCLGHLEKLRRRIVNWAAGTANRSVFSNQPGETIMKTLVTYNATASATTANGRKRDGAITGVSVQADGGGGNSLTWRCFGDNLLETLQELAPLAGGDFDLVQTGANTYEFRWYAGQLGTDRTATVTFSEGNGTMGEWEYEYMRLEEGTVACVWGQGEESEREYVTRTGPDYSVDNDREIFVDANDIKSGDTAGLNARGDSKLDEARARERLRFKVHQTPATLFGKHYFLGDLATAVHPVTGAAIVVKVWAVSLGLSSDGKETLDVEAGTP
jgi:hypothetical protein